MDNNLIPGDKNYIAFLEEIKTKITTTRIQIARSANKHLIQFYWWMGEHIVSKQEQYGWGKSIVEQLALDLRILFPNTKGFSAPNLWHMRHFFLEYKELPYLQQLVREIGWSHNLLIFSKIKDPLEREFYIKASIELGWSRNVLALQIDSNLYHRQNTIEKHNNFKAVLTECLAEEAHATMKSVYMLDMLGLKQPVLEAQLETKMVEKIKDVMMKELGKGFTFMGNQYPIRASNNKDYFIDLLFFNRKLQVLFAIELKAGSYKPEYASKMAFYLKLLDDFVREPHENPSIGLILCKDHDQFEVEYSLGTTNKPVGVANYHLDQELAKKYQEVLPDPKLLKAHLQKHLELSCESENNE